MCVLMISSKLRLVILISIVTGFVTSSKFTLLEIATYVVFSLLTSAKLVIDQL